MNSNTIKIIYLFFAILFFGLWIVNDVSWIVYTLNLAESVQVQFPIWNVLDNIFLADLINVSSIPLFAFLIVFLLNESERHGVANWWLYLFLALIMNFEVAFFLFLFSRERAIERDPSSIYRVSYLWDMPGSKIYLYLFIFAVSVETAKAAYYSIRWGFFEFYGSYLNQPLFQALSTFMGVPFVIYFLIENTRRQIKLWGVPIIIQLVISSIIAIPLFTYLREYSLEAKMAALESEAEAQNR